jgi:hypothetical protein
VRRILTGLLAFIALTATLLILPVYAKPAPKAHPVKTSIDEVALGSVVEPEGDAVVTTDGQVLPGGIDEPAATPPVPTPPAPTGSEDTGAEATGSQTSGSQTSGSQTSSPEATESEAPAGSGSPTATGDGDIIASGEELPGVPALTVSRPDTDRFSTVGVTWREDPSVTDVVVHLRVKDDAGHWGDWSSLEPDDIEQTSTAETAGNDVRAGTAPYWTGRSYGIEVTVQGAGGAVPEDVQLTLLDPGKSAADAAPATATRVQDQAHAATSMPAIITREAWGADPSIMNWDPEYAPTIKAATIHHTADTNDYTAADVPAIMRSIYAYHSVTRGWGDIGYNVIVDKFGRIFEGRYGGLTSTVVGAHAGGFNTGTFGVSMLGNYDEVDTPAAVLESVSSVIAWKLGIYGVNPYGSTQLTSGGGGTSKYPAGQVVTLPTIFAHRDVGSTVCPGQYAYGRMGQIRDLVAARMTTPGGSPVGNLEAFSLSGGDLTVSGWTYDPDYPPGGIAVAVDVDGVRKANLVASQPRADVGAVHPQAGPNHGFSGTIPLASGQRRVCVYLLNAPPSGLDTWLTCRVLNVTAVPPVSQLGDNPVGNTEALQASGRSLSFSGWTFDPSAPTSPVDVHVYVDGSWAGSVRADQTRNDVAAVHPEVGPAHGFSGVIPFSRPGSFQICLFAINQGAGDSNPSLGCKAVDFPASAWDPQGNLEAATVSGGQVIATGWGLDADAPTSPAAVHLFVDGAYRKSLVANTSRPDVGAIFPGFGNAHGFSGAVLVGGGRHSVCAFVLNAGNGTQNTLVGCRIVDLPAAASLPIGNPDTITRTSTGLTVAGWALDPDNPTQPISVHVYIDGHGAGSGTTGQPRADVGSVFPEAGPNHGFSVPVTVGSGQHQVCVYGINVGPGTTNPLLLCRSVSV